MFHSRAAPRRNPLPCTLLLFRWGSWVSHHMNLKCHLELFFGYVPLVGCFGGWKIVIGPNLGHLVTSPRYGPGIGLGATRARPPSAFIASANQPGRLGLIPRGSPIV